MFVARYVIVEGSESAIPATDLDATVEPTPQPAASQNSEKSKGQTPILLMHPKSADDRTSEDGHAGIRS
jgi:hypothetical protein